MFTTNKRQKVQILSWALILVLRQGAVAQEAKDASAVPAVMQLTDTAEVILPEQESADMPMLALQGQESRSVRGPIIIYFYPNKWEALPESDQELDAVGDYLAAVKGARVMLGGYAAPFGTAAGREAVARKRAGYVRRYLKTHFDIADERFAGEWFGVRSGLENAENTLTREERGKQARVVEIFIIDPPPPPPPEPELEESAESAEEELVEEAPPPAQWTLHAAGGGLELSNASPYGAALGIYGNFDTRLFEKLPRLRLGVRAGFTTDFGRSNSVVMALYGRWAFFQLPFQFWIAGTDGRKTEIFAHAGLGMSATYYAKKGFIEDAIMPVFEAGGGARVPLAERFWAEALLRFGIPFIWGVSIGGGVCF